MDTAQGLLFPSEGSATPGTVGRVVRYDGAQVFFVDQAGQQTSFQVPEKVIDPASARIVLAPGAEVEIWAEDGALTAVAPLTDEIPSTLNYASWGVFLGAILLGAVGGWLWRRYISR